MAAAIEILQKQERNGGDSMTEKGVAGLSILVILLLWAAHAAYGYWTDQVGVGEEFAVVWPLEVEIETEENTETEAGDGETDTGFSADMDANEIADETGAGDTEGEPADGAELEYDAEQADDGQTF